MKAIVVESRLYSLEDLSSAITNELRWNTTGITVAGIFGQSGRATEQLYGLSAVVVDFENTLYVSERANNRAKTFARDSTIGVMVAGRAKGTAGNTSDALAQPVSLLVDSDRNLCGTDWVDAHVHSWEMGAASGRTLAENDEREERMIRFFSR